MQFFFQITSKVQRFCTKVAPCEMRSKFIEVKTCFQSRKPIFFKFQSFRKNIALIRRTARIKQINRHESIFASRKRDNQPYMYSQNVKKHKVHAPALNDQSIFVKILKQIPDQITPDYNFCFLKKKIYKWCIGIFFIEISIILL